MTSLLEGGAVDVIGLGRPLAIDPELANTLLAGGDGVDLPSLKLPTVAGLTGESEWYEVQIGRIGRDLSDPAGGCARRPPQGVVVAAAGRDGGAGGVSA